MAVLPTRAYRPKDKALVEGAVKLIYRSIYTAVSKDVFTSLQTLNTAIMGALEQHNNANLKEGITAAASSLKNWKKQSCNRFPSTRMN